MKLLKQSLLNISTYIENHPNPRVIGTEDSTTVSTMDFRDEFENRRPQPYYHRSVKMDLPRFDGENGEQCLFQAERFFF